MGLGAAFGFAQAAAFGLLIYLGGFRLRRSRRGLPLAEWLIVVREGGISQTLFSRMSDQGGCRFRLW